MEKLPEGEKDQEQVTEHIYKLTDHWLFPPRTRPTETRQKA